MRFMYSRWPIYSAATGPAKAKASKVVPDSYYCLWDLGFPLTGAWSLSYQYLVPPRISFIADAHIYSYPLARSAWRHVSSCNPQLLTSHASPLHSSRATCVLPILSYDLYSVCSPILYGLRAPPAILHSMIVVIMLTSPTPCTSTMTNRSLQSRSTYTFGLLILEHPLPILRRHSYQKDGEASGGLRKTQWTGDT